MSSHIRRIAICTGGGDAPGLNAVIRSVVISATRRGWECYGIREGFNGILFHERYPGGGVFRLTPEKVRGIGHLGGTILGTTNKGNPLQFPMKMPDGTIREVDRTDEILEFARDLIRCPSVNPPGDERAVAELVTSRLRALGIDDVRTLAEVEERPNLIARIHGQGAGPVLILSGHLDTKPPGDQSAWRTDPWDPVIDGERMVGLGSGDMKAAVAGMVYAAAALKAAGEFGGELQLVFTADEEAGSTRGSRWLAAEGHLRLVVCERVA